MTDEAATQPTFRRGEDTDNPLGDTAVPTQDGTVTDPAVFRQEPPGRSPEPEEPPAKPSPAPPPLVKIDGEKLPQTGWMYRSDSEEFGPVDLAGLAELAEAGADELDLDSPETVAALGRSLTQLGPRRLVAVLEADGQAARVVRAALAASRNGTAGWHEHRGL